MYLKPDCLRLNYMNGYYSKIIKKATFLVLSAGFYFIVRENVFAAIPNDPSYENQAYVWNQIGAPLAWDYATGSKRIVVAMIDTGMDIWHEDLRDNLWVNGEEAPGNGIDDDHNGYTDDINGWNFVENNNDVRTSVFDVTDDKEAVRHGTLVGGQIGARGNNGLDGTGVSWRVSLMPLRAIRSNGSGSFRAVTRAVNYAIDNGADIISLSFIGDVAEVSLLEALKRAYDRGIVVVVAAGNYDSTDSRVGNMDIKPLYPACFDSQSGDSENWLLTVGSVDIDDKLSSFSNYGKCLDIMASGEYIYNTERYAPQYGYPNEFGGPWFGTSFATPIVAGSVALIKSIHPEWSPKKIISTILSTVDPIDKKNPGQEGQVGKGRINIGRAVMLAAASPLADGKGSIFYTKKSVLWRDDLGGDKRSSVIRNLNGLPITVTDFPNYNQERVAVLVKRGSKFFLDVYESDGLFVEEKAVPNSTATGRTTVKFSSGILTVYSSQFKKSNGKSEVVIFNTRSGKTKKIIISGEVMDTSISDDGNLNFVIKQNNKLFFESRSADNKPILSKPLDEFGGVLANETAGGKTVLIAQRGKKIYLVTVDSASGNFNERYLSEVSKDRWYIKIMTMAAKSYFLPYTDKGGSFLVYDGDLLPALTAKVKKR